MKAIKLWGTGDLVKNQTTIPIDGSTVYDHIEALEGNDIDNHISIRRSVRNLVDNDEVLFKFMEAVFTDSFEESFSGIIEDALKYSLRVEPSDIFFITDNTQTAGLEKAFLRVRPGIAQINGNVVFSYPSLFIAERELEKVFNLDTWHPIPESVEILYDIETDLFHARIKKKDQNLNVQIYDFTDPEFSGQGPAAFGDFSSGGHPSAISLLKEIELHPTLGGTFRTRVGSLDAINLEPTFEIPVGETDIEIIVGISADGEIGTYIDGYSELSTFLAEPYFILYKINVDTTGSEIVISELNDEREFFRSLFNYVDDSIYVGKEEPTRWTTRRFRVPEEDSEGDLTGNELNLLVDDGQGGTVEFRTSDYPAWIDVTRNDRYHWKIRHDDGWKKASPDIPEDIGALSVRDLGVTVPRLSDIGNAAFRNTGIQPNQIPLSSNIWLRDNIIVTVGPGGQFTTINAAITFLSNYKTTYRREGLQATIRLLDGYVMREQVLVNDLDLGWIRIETLGGITPVDVSSFVSGSQVVGFDRPETSTLRISNYTTFATTTRLNNQYFIVGDNVSDESYVFSVDFKENLSDISDLNNAQIDFNSFSQEYYAWFNVDSNGTDPEVSEKTGIEVNLYTTNTATIDFGGGDASTFLTTYLEDIFVGSQEYYIYFNVDEYYEEISFPEPDGWENVFVNISSSDSESDVATALAAAMNNINGITSSAIGNVVTFDTGTTEGNEQGDVIGGGVLLNLASYDENGVAAVFSQTINNLGEFSTSVSDNTVQVILNQPGFVEEVNRAVLTNAGTSNAIDSISDVELGSSQTYFYVWFNVEGNGINPEPENSLRIEDGLYAEDYGIEIELNELEKANDVLTKISTAIDEFAFEYLTNGVIAVDSIDQNVLTFSDGNVISSIGNDVSFLGQTLTINNYPVGTEPLINHAVLVFDGVSNLGHYFWINPAGLSTDPSGSTGFGEKEIPLLLGDSFIQVRDKILAAIDNENEFNTIISNGNIVIINEVPNPVTLSAVVGNQFTIAQTVAGVGLGFRTRLNLQTVNQFFGQRKELVVNFNGGNASGVEGEFLEIDVYDSSPEGVPLNTLTKYFFWFGLEATETLPEDLEYESNVHKIEVSNFNTVTEEQLTILISEKIDEVLRAETNYSNFYDTILKPNGSEGRFFVFFRNQIFENIEYSGGFELNVEEFELGDRVIIRDHVSETEEVDYNGLWFVYDTDDTWLELDFDQNENSLFNIDRAGGTAVVASPAPVSVERAALTTLWEFFYRPAFGVARGTLPLIACDFRMDESGDNPYMSYKDGLCATDQGKINILPFCGFSNAGGTNIYGTRASIINANDAIANDGKRYGIWAYASTIINARRAQVNNCGFGAYENSIVEIDEERSTSGIFEPIPRVDDLTVSESDLEVYLPFDDEDFTDDSGNNRTATTAGTVTFVDSIFGGKAASVESGSSGVITYTGIPNFQPGDSFTLSVWAAMSGLENNSTSSNVGTILGKGSTSNSVGIGFRTSLNGENPRLHIGSRAVDIIEFDFPVELEEYYHIVFVYEPGTQKTYINGELVDQRSNPGAGVGSFASTDFNSFSSNAVPSGNASKPFGKIDEPRIYSEALTEEEIKQLYENPQQIEAQTSEVKFEKAFDFTSPAALLKKSPNSTFTNRGFSISSWVWRDSSYNLSDGRLFDKTETSNAENGFYFSITENGTVNLGLAGRERRGAPAAIPEEEWTHLAITFDERNIMYFVNGEMVAESVNDVGLTTITTENPFTIGNRSLSGDKPFKGYIEEVRLYDFVLNPFQIEDLASDEKALQDTEFFKVFDEFNQPIGNGIYATRASIINASGAMVMGSFGDNVIAEYGSTINLDAEEGAEETITYYSYYGENVNVRNANVYENGGVRGVNILTTVKQIG